MTELDAERGFTNDRISKWYFEFEGEVLLILMSSLIFFTSRSER